MSQKWIDTLQFKTDSLLPVIAQDAQSNEVLMVAFANRAALELTAQTGFAHYYSRSRKTLWKKGETSGNLQKVLEIWIDCDEDTVLYRIEQTGSACHTGNRSCFYRKVWERTKKA